MSEQDHGPKQHCTAFKCGLAPEGRADECPFYVRNTTSETQPPTCEHEWRQYWVVDRRDDGTVAMVCPDGYYCVYNPKHRLADENTTGTF